jgi:hypothetical protein
LLKKTNESQNAPLILFRIATQEFHTVLAVITSKAAREHRILQRKIATFSE